MAYYAVFIVQPVIRAGVVRAVQETVHFVLVEIDHTYVAVVIIVVDVVGAGLAVGDFLLVQVRHLRYISSIESVATALRLSSAVIPARRL